MLTGTWSGEAIPKEGQRLCWVPVDELHLYEMAPLDVEAALLVSHPRLMDAYAERVELTRYDSLYSFSRLYSSYFDDPSLEMESFFESEGFKSLLQEHVRTRRERRSE